MFLGFGKFLLGFFFRRFFEFVNFVVREILKLYFLDFWFWGYFRVVELGGLGRSFFF